MEHDEEILNLLLDRYERSGHCLPGKQSNKRIALTMRPKEYAVYTDNDPKVQEINSIVLAMANEGLVSFAWRKGYENWLLDKVYLELGRLSDAYARVNRIPLVVTAQTLLQLIQLAQEQITTPWKCQFLSDEYTKLCEKLRPSPLLPQDSILAEAILKVLAYTEQGPELMRVISTNCFQNSKYLEKNLVSKLVSIAKAYEPELMKYRAMEEDVLSQNEVLKQIGILTYPEIYEMHGCISLVLAEAVVDTGAFGGGFCLQSENVDSLLKLQLGGTKTVLFVENRTNYRRLVLNGGMKDTLIVFHGGFYSQAKRNFFRVIADNLSTSIEVKFWGDIDLGGFLMFTRLKRDLFPELVPYRMDQGEYETYKAFGIERSATYLELLRQRMTDGSFDLIFNPVAESILAYGRTVEQEIML
ncbi:MAG: Wadjet anti-phage system protein JetD domain-containing protein [Faecousia sp.]